MVRPNAPAVYQQRMIIGRTEKDVLAELRRRSLAGELHSAAPVISPITQGPHAGRYAVPVYLRAVETPARRPIWRKVAAASAGVLLLAGLTGWLLSTLSGTALIILMIVALAMLVRRVQRTIITKTTMRARRTHGAVTVTTTTTTRITVR